MEVSSAVKEKIEELMADDSDLTITVANDTSDTILDSLKRRSRDNGSGGYHLHAHHFPVLGDYKASLIVGSSIPDSICVLDCDHDGRIFVERYHDECAGTRRRHDGR